ncbi:LARP4 protein, partial [Upupa epops]|nr:LARP4 protein [Upupa epops]
LWCLQQVTSKGAGLNPNAKVWQEVAQGSGEAVPPTNGAEHAWQETAAAQGAPGEGNAELAEDGCKQYEVMYPPSCEAARNGTAVDEASANGIVLATEELGYQIYEVSGEGSPAVSTEDIRECLKKQLEFCFSRENLSKDLYLMSQMDSDQFVPIWTIANMEGIKKLTTDMDLILDVLRSSPMVQVDERGEKVRPNHKRCIIILREIPETTPIEVNNCGRGCTETWLGAWSCLTEQPANAAEEGQGPVLALCSALTPFSLCPQAFRYLREEVKTFQGKPVMARIKAINTFFAKNGYRVVDSSVYSQPVQTPAQFASPLFMQPVYSPQQYSIYSIVPQTWSPNPAPYFETPLAPFPNGGFVNGFNTPGSYKANAASLSIGRPFHRNRVKPHFRSSSSSDHAAEGPAAVGALSMGDGQLSRSNSRSFVMERHSSTVPGPQEQGYSQKDSPTAPMEQNGDYGVGRGRRSVFRGRRRREDDRVSRPQPSAEAKAQTPKFDLLASNFPPLPGSTAKIPGEPVLESRMADVVKGVCKEKESKESLPSCPAPAEEEQAHSSIPQPGTNVSSPSQPEAVELSNTVQPESHPEEVCAHKDGPSHTSPPLSVSSPVSAVKPPRTNPSSPPASVSAAPAVSMQEPRKLSYAEVCQKPPKEPPPVAVQPLREHRANIVPPAKPEENGSPEKAPEKPPDKVEGRMKDYSGFRGNGPPARGGAAGKIREQRRQFGRRASPQGAPRRVGKEQYLPPRSPK